MAPRTTAAKKAATSAASTVETAAVAEKPVVKKAAPATRTVKLDDTTLIRVRSNTFGELIYINRRTGDKTVWSGHGDVQTLTMGDLRAMKGTQRAFFENQWIFLDGVDEAGYEDVTPVELYKALMVTQYYQNIIDPKNFNEIFSWDAKRIKEAVAMMSDGAKMNLVVAANTAINDGALDSLKKIRTLEECLNCELTKPE